MGRDYFLDKDLIIDVNGNIYLVYTNINPYGYVYAMLKYVYTGKGIWKGYERVLKEYGVKNMLKLNQDFTYEPCYGVSFPTIKKSRIRKHLLPEERLIEIIKSPKDELEEKVVSLYYEAQPKRAGITGSILAGIHHEKSDIDLVVYGCKESVDFLESFSGFDEDKEWVIETSKNYGLSLDHAKSLYDKRVRGVFNGVKFSVLFVNDKVERPCQEVCVRIRKVKFRAEVEADCNALFYPSRVYLHNVSGLEEKPSELISYEGIYSLLLYKQRTIEVEGMLINCNGEYKVVVGDRDAQGYVRGVL